jgi:low affinity Fe/Cu permease
MTQNIALVGSPVLTGRVTAGGANVAGATVTAYNLAGVSVMGATTNASGTYTLALPAGSYKLFVTSPLVGFPSQWVGGATFTTAAITVFTVTATQNIALHP